MQEKDGVAMMDTSPFSCCLFPNFTYRLIQGAEQDNEEIFNVREQGQ